MTGAVLTVENLAARLAVKRDGLSGKPGYRRPHRAGGGPR